VVGAQPARFLSLILLLGAACAAAAPTPAWPPADPLSVRHRDRQSWRRAHAVVLDAPGAPAATDVFDRPLAVTRGYRTLLAPALGARCRMIPSDSEYVDRRTRTCGGLMFAAWAVARVLLEVGATATLLPATVQGGRLHFVDLPPAPGDCP
jgi:hypothetical protein